MKIALECSSSNEHWNGGCAFAFVDVTPELLQQISKRIRQVKAAYEADHSLDEMQYTCYNAVYFTLYGPEEISEALAEQIEVSVAACDWAELPEDFEVPESHIQRTECDQMVVSSTGSVRFTCYPKHSDVLISSARMPPESNLKSEEAA